MEKSNMQGNDGLARRLLFMLAGAAAMIGGGLLTVRLLWGAAAPGMLFPCLLAALTWAGWIGSAQPACPKTLRWGLRLAPWLFSFVLGHSNCLRGFFQLANGVIYSWNTLHRGGVREFEVYATEADVLAAALIFAVLLAQLIADIQLHRRVWAGVLLAGALLLPQLLAGGVSSWACALYLSGLLGVWMSLPGDQPLPQSMRTLEVCVLVLFVCAALVPGGQLESMEDLRENIAGQVHMLRYGSRTLPYGDIKKAQILHAEDKVMLAVSTEQEKDLYLTGFVGGEYTNECWLPLADSAYTGEYRGMLRWLNQNGFDPFSQSAQYYALCENTELEENTVAVTVQNACRSTVYAPRSAKSVAGAEYKEKNDTELMAGGAFGAQQYQIAELSSPRPAELTVREEWVSEPHTEAQQAYAEAEEVYRNFVYENYTTPDPSLQKTVWELFWQDYDDENSGVYSAVDRVRKVLSQNTRYTEKPAARGTSAMQNFLSGRTAGNAVYYATAAVQALRAKGIPARYAEGYYAAASDVQAAGGTLLLTGQNAHAWPEVYFDGVGWLPVDVTPGYYRDAVTLQQMIALPDAVHKTAALQDDAPGAEELLENAGETGAQVPDLQQAVWRAAAVLLGILALCLIACMALVLLLEFARYLTWQKKNARYRKADPMGKAHFLHNRIANLLDIWGIQSCLGWNTEKTDEEISRKVPPIAPGEYTRAAQLLEKFLYGGIAPEPYEIHTLEVFVAKLCDAQNMEKRRYWRMRYSHMRRKYRMQ